MGDFFFPYFYLISDDVLVGSLHELTLIVPCLKISVAHVNYLHANIPPTLIGLFSVLVRLPRLMSPME